MSGRKQALDSARTAQALLAERMSINPVYAVHAHASEQLERMIEDLGHACLAPAATREWVDIGLMAVKELEAVDPDLANALMDADHDFKHAR